MSNFLREALSFIIGALFSAANWYLLYKIYKISFAGNIDGKMSRKKKNFLVVMALLKVFLIFGGLYIVIVVFKFNVLYLLLGFVICLICMTILMFRKNQ